jgi:tetratricopeptide (TPR) repeat protein
LVTDDNVAWAYHNFGYLYADQGKLTEEQMYQRALEGYEKGLGIDNTTIYIPALNVISNFVYVFECQSGLEKARMMYSKALVGYERIAGPNQPSDFGFPGRKRGLERRR